MKTITTAIIKGGTGKTATAAALSQAAAADGKNVLAIDLDPQANLTFALHAETDRAGAFQLLTGRASAKEAIQDTVQGVDVIAASPDLATIRNAPGAANVLKETLEPVTAEYDFCFIDTPPQMGVLTYSALQAADGLLIPLEAERASIQGLYQILDIAGAVQKSNPGLTVTGVIVTRYDARPRINRAMMEAIIAAADACKVPFLGQIRAGVSVREATGLQISLIKYAKKSKPAQDYLSLYEEIKKNQ